MYKWLIGVIDSCENLTQLSNSENLLNNYKKLYGVTAIAIKCEQFLYHKYKSLKYE